MIYNDIHIYIYIHVFFLHPTVPPQHPTILPCPLSSFPFLSGLHELWSFQPGLHLLHAARQGAWVAVALGDHPLQQPGPPGTLGERAKGEGAEKSHG